MDDKYEFGPGARGLRSPASRRAGERSYNERLVLTLLRRDGPAPKARIAEMTGLSAQSASVIMRKLEAEGLIERCAPVRGRVGQPSIPMRLAERGALFFGLKVGRRSADLVLVDFLGTIIGRRRRTYTYPSPGRTLRFAAEAVEALSAQLSDEGRARIAGLGIAIPGYLWEWGRQVGVPERETEAWRGRDFRAEVAALFDFPVLLQNDASSACGAEVIFGKAAYPADFLYFYVGHFIGGGVVINHGLYTGPTGNAGALGPLPVPAPGGGIRQLVDVASLHGLENDLERAGSDPSILWKNATTWKIDEEILDAWLDRAAGGMAYALAATCSVVDFELAIIDGWLPGPVRSALIERTRAAMDGMNWAGLVVPELREGSIGPDARSLGAASLPLSSRFHVAQHLR